MSIIEQEAQNIVNRIPSGEKEGFITIVTIITILAVLADVVTVIEFCRHTDIAEMRGVCNSIIGSLRLKQIIRKHLTVAASFKYHTVLFDAVYGRYKEMTDEEFLSFLKEKHQ